MGFDENIEMVRLAFYQVLASSGPFLGAAWAIGLFNWHFTSCNIYSRNDSSFVPKMVSLVIFAMGFWLIFFRLA